MANPNEKRSVWQRLGPAGILGILWATLPALCGFYLLAQLGPVSEYLRSHGTTGVLLYVFAFIVSAGLGLLPTYAQAVLGGWVFGFELGLPAALAGFTGAAIVGYCVARFVSRDRVAKVIAEHPKSAAISEALIGHGFARTLGIVALLRLPPNSPFALTNLAMAGSGVAPTPYALGTLIGMTPRTAVAVFFAAAAASSGAKDIQSFVRDGLGLGVFIGGIVVMCIVLAIIGSIANRAIERVAPCAVAKPDEVSSAP